MTGCQSTRAHVGLRGVPGQSGQASLLVLGVVAVLLASLVVLFAFGQALGAKGKHHQLECVALQGASYGRNDWRAKQHGQLIVTINGHRNPGPYLGAGRRASRCLGEPERVLGASAPLASLRAVRVTADALRRRGHRGAEPVGARLQPPPDDLGRPKALAHGSAAPSACPGARDTGARGRASPAHARARTGGAATPVGGSHRARNERADRGAPPLRPPPVRAAVAGGGSAPVVLRRRRGTARPRGGRG
jgi:hypothetical protein